MMLTPRLNSCATDTISLIGEIDCTMYQRAKILYGNTTLMLNTPFDGEATMKLLHYRRILTYRTCNPEYGGDYTLSQIAGRIKILKHKR